MRKIVTVYIFFALFVADISATFADKKEEAVRYFDQGIRLQKQNDNIGACEAFEKSVEAYTNKNNLYNLANCYRVLNRPLDALSTFEMIERDFSDKLKADMAADIELQIKEITESLVQFTIATTPEGAVITVDDKPMGETPMKEPMVLTAGEHTVAISKDGYETIVWKGFFTSGAREEKTFTLNQPNVAGPPQPEPTVEKSQPVLAEEAEPVQTETPEKTGHKIWTPLLIAGLSGTTVMAGVSVGLWAAAVHRQKEFNQINAEMKSTDDSAWDSLENQRTDAKKASETYNAAAIVTTAVTGALAALTVIAVVFKKNEKREAPKDMPAVSLVPVGVEVRF